MMAKICVDRLQKCEDKRVEGVTRSGSENRDEKIGMRTAGGG